MSVEAVEKDALAALANALATSMLEEFKLDGIILKVHVGDEAASVALTSKRAPRLLDDIVLGQLEAMSKYAREAHGARETSGMTELTREDGSSDIARSGVRVKGGES